MPGSKVIIWKQDPSVNKIGYRTSYIHTDVKKGPSDRLIKLLGITKVNPNQDNDFLFSPEENPLEFDAVHTFSVVRHVITMYERALGIMGHELPFQWQWGSKAISVYPRAGLEANAFYNRNEKSLSFYYFHPQNDTSKPLVYTCRSFDIVSHETGHAVLDALRPGYWHSWDPETWALHESFGDLTSIFTSLSQLDMCEAIVAESKLNLHNKTFFSSLAEEYGKAIFGHSLGLRNANNTYKMSDVSDRPHELSQVFTGAVYDILADIFQDHLVLSRFDPAETLFRIGRHIAALVVSSILKGPEENATFADIANLMIENENWEDSWKQLIRNRFEEREILGNNLSFAPRIPKEINWKSCCGTLHTNEHRNSFKEALEKTKQ